MADIVLLDIVDNQGYAPEQVDTKLTLQMLLDSVQEAIEQFGPDAKIVLSNGQRYGAGFGKISTYSELFRDAEADEDEDY